MSLKDLASLARSGSDSGAMRASNPPEAISPAVVATREIGRNRRRLVDQPSAPAKIVVTAAPIASAVPIARSARSVSRRGMASKYCAWAAGMLMPTAMNGSPLTLNRCVALPPWATYDMSSAGYAVVGNAASESEGSSLPLTRKKREALGAFLQALDQGVDLRVGYRRDLQEGGSHRGGVGDGLCEDRLDCADRRGSCGRRRT